MALNSAHSSDGSKCSLAYLQAELTRTDLLLRRYALRQQAENAQNDLDEHATFSGLDIGGWRIASRYAWHTAPNSVFTEDPEWTDAYAAAVRRSVQAAQQATRAGDPPHLQRLATAFGLDAFDLDIFLLALLPALDPTIDRYFAVLQDDVTLTYPTVKLTLDVLCDAADLSRLTQLAHFAPDAPLFRYGLLVLGGEPRAFPTPLLGQGLSVDPVVVVWLLGRYQPHSALGAHAKLEPPQVDMSDELLAAEAWPRLATLVLDPIILAFHGPDGESQAAAARLFASQRSQPLLTVDLPALLKTGTTLAGPPSPATAIHFALRDARLAGAIPYLVGLDACLEEGSLPAALWTLMAEQPGSVITSSTSRWRTDKDTDKEWAARPIAYQAFPMPGYAQRHALWSYYLGEAAKDKVDVTALSGQFALESGRIRNVVAAAQLAAQQRGESAPSQEDFFAAARAYSSTRLGDLAHKVRSRHNWEDLVLPPEKIELLRELVAMVRGRPKVLDEWGVAGKLAPSRAVIALFSGEPGTGKTMAADVIAGNLGLDLYKIELSSLVDKYIGETEKNLERIFKEAESANAILFFDEADAIFGKRTGVKDAHDRYANVGVSYLLQRMESFDGITILATNLRANLDEAFTRRLHFVVDFPFPGVEERLRIWQALFPLSVPRAADVDLAWLAQRYKLAGGNIRNIIVSAAYLAADVGDAVGMSHLQHGARRELQKMGRLSVGDMEDYARHVEARDAKPANDLDDPMKARFYRIRPTNSI